MDAPAEFYTIKEVSERLRVADNTVRNAIRRKKLRAYKFLGTYRVKAEDLAAFVEASAIGREEGGAETPCLPKLNASTFTHLDGARLREAWRRRGVLPDPDEAKKGRTARRTGGSR